jgi:hypothetical protein
VEINKYGGERLTRPNAKTLQRHLTLHVILSMQAPSGNEVDDVIRDLKKISGFTAYVILNNDGTSYAFFILCHIRLVCGVFTLSGIVIKYENMSYKVAVHHAHLILGLYGKAIKYTRDLFDPPDVSTQLSFSSACTVRLSTSSCGFLTE